jgi:hypothetical protein
MTSLTETPSDSSVTVRVAGRAMQAQPVLVTDFQMPFASMVGFMVKWAIAAIPAIIILCAIFAICGALLGGFFASAFHH